MKKNPVVISFLPLFFLAAFCINVDRATGKWVRDGPLSRFMHTTRCDEDAPTVSGQEKFIFRAGGASRRTPTRESLLILAPPPQKKNLTRHRNSLVLYRKEKAAAAAAAA